MTFHSDAETRHELLLARPITRADLAAAFGPDIVFGESPDGGDFTFFHPFHSIRIRRRPPTDIPGPQRSGTGSCGGMRRCGRR
ncbi:hypothetical protein [Actinomyces israelii]|uniref:Uncharacterized protein n=1 Tax=Actinomyces israelii TaxID=1659 RepID=A0ABT4I7P9_9ACTO|nr:hypothetical protein [Actinomyces israelii]MCZ0857762.1 hypothetical protein [Actinomyces israelii]